ncbi:hypothetical protein CR513_02344, partial [Mucuna pruriens]
MVGVVGFVRELTGGYNIAHISSQKRAEFGSGSSIYNQSIIKVLSTEGTPKVLSRFSCFFKKSKYILLLQDKDTLFGIGNFYPKEVLQLSQLLHFKCVVSFSFRVTISLTSCWLLSSSLSGIPNLFKSNPSQRSSKIIRVFSFSFFNLFRVRYALTISLSTSNLIPNISTMCP